MITVEQAKSRAIQRRLEKIEEISSRIIEAIEAASHYAIYHGSWAIEFTSKDIANYCIVESIHGRVRELLAEFGWDVTKFHNINHTYIVEFAPRKVDSCD